MLRQVGELRAAINEARGLIRQNPKYVAAYPSLVGNFGTLGAADSVGAYLRRGMAQGAPRASLVPALDPLVNTVLRHASLYGSTYGWEGQIASAMRVDSVLSTASTKFLVAALIAQSAEKRIAEIGALVSGSSWVCTRRATCRRARARRAVSALPHSAPCSMWRRRVYARVGIDMRAAASARLPARWRTSRAGSPPSARPVREEPGSQHALDVTTFVDTFLVCQRP